MCMVRTAITQFCNVCGDRTCHNVVRHESTVGRYALCREHTDVVERLESGEYRLYE